MQKMKKYKQIQKSFVDLLKTMRVKNRELRLKYNKKKYKLNKSRNNQYN